MTDEEFDELFNHRTPKESEPNDISETGSIESALQNLREKLMYD